MNKNALAEHLAKEVGLTKTQAKECVSAVFNIMADTLAEKENIQIIGFGSWNIKHRKARTMKSPMGGTIDLPDRHVVTFKAGKSLKDRVA